jgi:hypothetical protein
MRKRREVKVATKELVYDDNLNIVGEKIKFVPLDEARARGEAFSRKIYDLEALGQDWRMRKEKKDGKVTFRAVLRVLAGIKRLYAGERDASGRQIDVVIPFNMLDVIGSTLDKAVWQIKQTRVKKAAGKQNTLRWNMKADEIRRRHPSWSGTSVAASIAADPTEWSTDTDGKVRKPSVRNIRRAIRRPKK